MVETIDVDHKDKIQFKLWEKLTIEASSPQDNLSFVGALLSLEAQSSSPWWWHLEWLAKSFYPLWSSTAFHPSFLSGATKQICSQWELLTEDELSSIATIRDKALKFDDSIYEIYGVHSSCTSTTECSNPHLNSMRFVVCHKN